MWLLTVYGRIGDKPPWETSPEIYPFDKSSLFCRHKSLQIVKPLLVLHNQQPGRKYMPRLPVSTCGSRAFIFTFQCCRSSLKGGSLSVKVTFNGKILSDQSKLSMVLCPRRGKLLSQGLLSGGPLSGRTHVFRALLKRCR